MRKYFPLVLNRLISLQTQQTQPVEQNMIRRYLQKRRLLKQYRKVWSQFNQKYIVNEAAQMYGRLRQACKINDKVQILRLCSIPMYEKYKENSSQIKFYQLAYSLKLWRLEKVLSNYRQGQSQRNKQEWLRAYIRFWSEQNGKITYKTHILQRRVTDQSINPSKKWYFYQIQQ